MEPQVLIVGAGPTGLVLALGLERQGIPFRIIDKNGGPGEASRALAVHARTLEFYRQFGFADEIFKRGIPISQLQIYNGRKIKAKAKLGDIGKGLSPYPYVLSLSQDEHEKILVKQLEQKGIFVEWNTELVSFRDEADALSAVTAKQGAEEETAYVYLCGCDGAHSSVRKSLKIGFPGGTYEQLFFVADVQSDQQIEGLQLNFFEGNFCLFMPVRETGQVRLVGLVPPDLVDGETVADFEDIARVVEENTGLQVKKLNWFSTYKVHHRVSENFRKGRVFIAGDAAHIHSPAGGQGMNTGIGDAMNLAWKLAAVIQGKAKEEILDSYEQERIGFARTLVETTDRLFQNMVRKDFSAKIFREWIFPYVLQLVFGMPFTRKTVFRRVSQIRIHYRDSMLSTGKAGEIHGGDRLPWIVTDDGDNFEPLRTMNWQFHVYGQVKPELRKLAEIFKLPLHAFPLTASAENAGISSGTVFLVRPDGYIGLADSEQNIAVIEPYLERVYLQSAGT